MIYQKNMLCNIRHINYNDYHMNHSETNEIKSIFRNFYKKNNIFFNQKIHSLFFSTQTLFFHF